MKSNLGRL